MYFDYKSAGINIIIVLINTRDLAEILVTLTVVSLKDNIYFIV